MIEYRMCMLIYLQLNSSEAVGMCSPTNRFSKYEQIRFVLPTAASPTTTHLMLRIATSSSTTGGPQFSSCCHLCCCFCFFVFVFGCLLFDFVLPLIGLSLLLLITVVRAAVAPSMLVSIMPKTNGPLAAAMCAPYGRHRLPE